MRIRRALVGAAALVAVGAGRALADDGFPDPSGDPGFPSIPAFFFVPMFLIIGLGVVSAVLRYKTGSRIAEKAGLDPVDGGMASLLSENGLPAAYVMGNLPQRTAAQPSTPPTRTVEQRLAELAHLLDAKLVTQGEYDTRRAAILNDV